MKISDTVLNILGQCRTEGNTLYLPDVQLDRITYQSVNKVLEMLGGKWNRKAKGHVFDYDPEEAIETVILTGDVEDTKKTFQFFPTPKEVGNYLCDLANITSESSILEPSCGNGSLADVIAERNPANLHGVELNMDMKRYLDEKPYPVCFCDFLSFVPPVAYDRIVMNPPFTKHQDIRHVMKAYEILAVGGILVSVMSVSPFFRTDAISVEFRKFLEEHNAEIIELPEGAFKESGTMVRTCIVKIVKE